MYVLGEAYNKIWISQPLHPLFTLSSLYLPPLSLLHHSVLVPSRAPNRLSASYFLTCGSLIGNLRNRMNGAGHFVHWSEGVRSVIWGLHRLLPHMKIPPIVIRKLLLYDVLETFRLRVRVNQASKNAKPNEYRSQWHMCHQSHQLDNNSRKTKTSVISFLQFLSPWNRLSSLPTKCGNKYGGTAAFSGLQHPSTTSSTC